MRYDANFLSRYPFPQVNYRMVTAFLLFGFYGYRIKLYSSILKEVKELKRMVADKDEELERKERELEQLRSFLVASTP